MKSYHDIAGDGGSGILEQVVQQRDRITTNLAGVKHLLAIGSGKGGVGKSTVTAQLAALYRARGLEIGVFDADVNGPSQARLLGVRDVPLVPTGGAIPLPRSRDGIGVFSIGSVLPEDRALGFDSVATGDSHTWRATREFAMMAGLLETLQFGTLDILLFDLPPGAERTAQLAEFLGPRARFVLVTIPSDLAHGVVARSVASLAAAGARTLGYVENMSGYHCVDCGSIKPLFPSTDPQALGIPRLGAIPFDPQIARLSDLGEPLRSDMRDSGPAAAALQAAATTILQRLEEERS